MEYSGVFLKMMSIFPESLLLLVVHVCVCREGETDGAEAGLILRNYPGLGQPEVRLGVVTDPVLTALGHSIECVTTLRTDSGAYLAPVRRQIFKQALMSARPGYPGPTY